MKKVLLVSLMAILLLGLSGCGEDKAKADSSETTSKSDSSVVAQKEKQTVPGVLIYTGWCLYEQRIDNMMYAVLEASAGDEIKFFLNDSKSVEQKKATRHLSNGTEEEFNFVHILYDGTEYWTRDIFVSDTNFTEPGIILTEAAVFAEPDILQITKTKLAPGTYVALSNIDAGDFYNAKIYNGTAFGREVYIQKENVDTHTTCIELVKTLSKLNKDTKAPVTNEIFDIILNKWELGTEGSVVCSPCETYFMNYVQDVESGKIKLNIDPDYIENANFRYWSNNM